MDPDSDDEAPILINLPSDAEPGVTTKSAEPSVAVAREVPCTILSGFLGSGKTTLIQYILRNPDHGKRIAVIENEFGEGLAVESIIARDGVDPKSNSLQEFIELPNGCMCCTVKDSLVSTLEKLVEQKKELDYILIEASGMANPGPIASVFWLDEALESRLRLDGIVTLVAANHIMEQLTTTEEAAQQIAYSDRLVINKIDCLPEENQAEALAKVTDALRKLHPTAPMITTTYSQVPDLEWILNANCFGGASRVEELDVLWNSATVNHEGHDQLSHIHTHDHHDHHGDCQVCQAEQQQRHPTTPESRISSPSSANRHRHTDTIATLAFQHAGSVSLPKLNAWLADILWPNQDETNEVLTAILKDPSKKGGLSHKHKHAMQIYRIKGIVSVVHDGADLLDSQEKEKYTTSVGAHGQLLDCRRYIVQAVHDLWDVHPGSDNLQFESSEERVGKVVLIGKHLARHRLEHGFHSCFVETASPSMTS